MMLATVDAGSNTIRLLIARYINGRFEPKNYYHRICRLLGGYSHERGLSLEAQTRALDVLQEFFFICQAERVQQIKAVGTAAFRQAINGKAFAAHISKTTQIPLEIISGEKEAQLTVAGVLHALDPIPDFALIFDIGGGSTEFTLCAGNKVLWSKSYPLGVVQLTESYPLRKERNEPIKMVLKSVKNEISTFFESKLIDPINLTVVGTAGTATTLAALDMQMSDYDWTLVNNYSLSCQKIQKWYDHLAQLSPVAREQLPGMEVGRGDLIISGIEIVLDVLKTMQTNRLFVSDFGLLEGLLLHQDNTRETP